MITTFNRVAIIGQPLEIAGGADGHIPWSTEKLQAVLDEKDSDTCDAIALYRIADKSYWVHRIIDAGWYLFATHPVVPNAAKEKELSARDGVEHLQIIYEHFILKTELASELEKIGPLLFFSVKIGVADELAISQASLEFFDILRAFLPVPIDEIFARTRNMGGNGVDPDLITAHMRMKNGSEGLLEMHCLSGQKNEVSVHFYGREGQFSWDGTPSTKNGISSPFLETIKSYQNASWLERSGRFDRVIDYREAMK